MLEDIVTIRRRMVVNKFSNRPPFNLKEEKSIKQSTSTESKTKKRGRIIKSNEEIPKNKSNSVGNQTMSSNSRKLNSIIPKVMESFQKVTPKIDSNYMDCSQDSLRTLFRNSNVSFGKHIPDHALMKNLLKNFDVNKKRDKVAYQVVDVIPTKEQNARCRVVMKKSLRKKLDKATSTSTLVWPPNALSLSNHCPDDSVPTSKVSSNTYKMNHRNKIEITVETCDTSEKLSENRYKPKTKTDNRYILPVNDAMNKRPEHGKGCLKCKGTRQDTYVVEKNANQKQAIGHLKAKEQSFVQTQVEKLNAIYAAKAGEKSFAVKRLGSKKFSYTHPIDVK